MKINKDQFLNDLELVRAGLSPKEFIEQSSCFVFKNGFVHTFNDEVACRKRVDVDFTGAVQATKLLDILHKLDDPEVDVDINSKGELEFRAKRKRFAVTMEAEIFLPIDKVERPEKSDWHPLDDKFSEAVNLVKNCVSGDENAFVLSCIHIHPQYVEACDNIQIMRCSIKTGLKRSTLVRGASLKHIVSLGMHRIALTRDWVHFRNGGGLVLSCRRWAEEYPDVGSILDFEGDHFVIPKGIPDAAERAAIFATDSAAEPQVVISLVPGKMQIKGEDVSGWYKEVKSVSYEGNPMSFTISPKLLKHIAERYSEAQLTARRMKIVGGTWQYATSLGLPSEAEQNYRM